MDTRKSGHLSKKILQTYWIYGTLVWSGSWKVYIDGNEEIFFFFKDKEVEKQNQQLTIDETASFINSECAEKWK